MPKWILCLSYKNNLVSAIQKRTLHLSYKKVTLHLSYKKGFVFVTWKRTASVIPKITVSFTWKKDCICHIKKDYVSHTKRALCLTKRGLCVCHTKKDFVSVIPKRTLCLSSQNKKHFVYHIKSDKAHIVEIVVLLCDSHYQYYRLLPWLPMLLCVSHCY